MIANGWQVRVPTVMLISLAVSLLLAAFGVTWANGLVEHVVGWMIGAVIGIVAMEIVYAWIEYRCDY